jgi:hypothetical protein
MVLQVEHSLVPLVVVVLWLQIRRRLLLVLQVHLLLLQSVKSVQQLTVQLAEHNLVLFVRLVVVFKM